MGLPLPDFQRLSVDNFIMSLSPTILKLPSADRLLRLRFSGFVLPRFQRLRPRLDDSLRIGNCRLTKLEISSRSMTRDRPIEFLRPCDSSDRGTYRFVVLCGIFNRFFAGPVIRNPSANVNDCQFGRMSQHILGH
jgi:hypothetical protein